MYIIDSLGMVITITDLKGSIEMVEWFLSYRHGDADLYPSLKRFDDLRHFYWKDIHEKLLQLQQESDNHE